jgi:hypothetical protein
MEENDSSHQIAQLYKNTIWGAGHEGIDVQNGKPIIEHKKIFDAHGGVVVVSGSPIIRKSIMKNVGSGVFTLHGATPIEEKDQIELAPPDSKLEWQFLNFAYQMYGDPVIYDYAVRVRSPVVRTRSLVLYCFRCS